MFIFTPSILSSLFSLSFCFTACLLWTDLLQVCRLILLCTDVFWVACTVISQTVWLHLSWSVLSEVYDQWLYLHLWQSGNDDITLNHVVCLMLLYVVVSFFCKWEVPTCKSKWSQDTVVSYLISETTCTFCCLVGQLLTWLKVHPFPSIVALSNQGISCRYLPL